MPGTGTPRAFFRGNGTNVVKIAPETAIKLSCNDRIKHWVCEDIEEITPAQRMLSGALAGAVAQVEFRTVEQLHSLAEAVAQLAFLFASCVVHRRMLLEGALLQSLVYTDETIYEHRLCVPFRKEVTSLAWAIPLRGWEASGGSAEAVCQANIVQPLTLACA